jgi:hypothetical protein
VYGGRRRACRGGLQVRASVVRLRFCGKGKVGGCC